MFLQHCVIRKTLQKIRDPNAMVKHICLAHLHIKTTEKYRNGMEKHVLCKQPLTILKKQLNHEPHHC